MLRHRAFALVVLMLFSGCGTNEVTVEIKGGDGRLLRLDADDLEFKFNAKGNSGVFMHVGDLKDHVKSGFEVQILDTYGKKNVGNHDCGGVIGAAAPSKNMVKPAGQWNRYRGRGPRRHDLTRVRPA